MFRKFLKWTLLLISVLIILIALTAWWLISDTNKAMEKTYQVEPAMIQIPTDSASLARGAKWTRVLCVSCHGDQLQGKTMFEDPDIGRIDASNLTSGIGGIGREYTDIDWIRAIKHGVKKTGHGAFVMPSKDFSYMGDEDLGCLIGYLKSLPPVDHTTNPPDLTAMAKVLAAMGAFGELFAAEVIDHNQGSAYVPEPGPTVEYGTYLVNVYGCRSCHGMTLNGGKDPNPNAPFGPNITPGGNPGHWSEQDFIHTMRTGITPEGKKLNAEFMPWKGLSAMDEDELLAVYYHLRALPALETPEEFRAD